MTGREWKPGDVAIATVHGEDVRVVRGHKAWITTPAPEGRDFPATYCALYDNGSEVHDPRPLVVIDPEDREQVERLIRLFCGHTPSGDADYVIGNGGIDNMQAALREFADPKPPRPEEPTGAGALVVDTNGTHWSRIRLTAANKWVSEFHDCATWPQIDVVRVLHEGVQP